jgi:hypothetical protein
MMKIVTQMSRIASRCGGKTPETKQDAVLHSRRMTDPMVVAMKNAIQTTSFVVAAMENCNRVSIMLLLHALVVVIIIIIVINNHNHVNETTP